MNKYDQGLTEKINSFNTDRPQTVEVKIDYPPDDNGPVVRIFDNAGGRGFRILSGERANEFLEEVDRLWANAGCVGLFSTQRYLGNHYLNNMMAP